MPENKRTPADTERFVSDVRLADGDEIANLCLDLIDSNPELPDLEIHDRAMSQSVSYRRKIQQAIQMNSNVCCSLAQTEKSSSIGE